MNCRRETEINNKYKNSSGNVHTSTSTLKEKYIGNVKLGVGWEIILMVEKLCVCGVCMSERVYDYVSVSACGRGGGKETTRNLKLVSIEDPPLPSIW